MRMGASDKKAYDIINNYEEKNLAATTREIHLNINIIVTGQQLINIKRKQNIAAT